MLGFMFTVRVRFPVKFGKMSASRSKRIIKPPRNISPETPPSKRKRASATTEPAAKVNDIFFLSNSRCESYESVSLTTLNTVKQNIPYFTYFNMKAGLVILLAKATRNTTSSSEDRSESRNCGSTCSNRDGRSGGHGR